MANRRLEIQPTNSYHSAVTHSAPPWLRYTSRFSDTERYAAMTPSERLDYFVEVCELARTILEGRADASEVLARVDPMPPLAEKAWLRLVREGSRAQKTR